MRAFTPVRLKAGFTLVELLVVIGIILILMGLVMTVIPVIQNRAKELKAEGVVQQITVAANAYYTEHSKFPTLRTEGAPPPKAGKDAWVGDPSMGASVHNNALFFTLRGIPKGPNAGDAANPTRMVYYSYNAASLGNSGKPRDGFFDRTADGSIPAADRDGNLYDPWGREYGIMMDSNGDERIDLEGIYVDFAGADRISGKAPRVQVGAFATGKDETLGSKGNRIYKERGEKSDDVVSWE